MSRPEPSPAVATLEAAGRGVILASLLAALVAQAWLAHGREGSWLLALDLLALPAAFLASHRWPAATLALLIAALPLQHAVLYVFTGNGGLDHFLPLSAALTGALLAAAPGGRWSLPGAWKGPLAFWALVVALTWPIVAARELGWPAALDLSWAAPVNAGGVPRRAAVVWVLHVAAAQLLGFLWIDALWRRCPTPRDLRRQVMLPLATGFGLAILVAFYQAFVDLDFLSPRDWQATARVTGTLMDGNHFGILAACLAPVPLVLLRGWRHRTRAVGALLALALGWLGALLSGSTSSLFILAATAVTMGLLAWRARREIRRRLGTGTLIAGVLLLAAAVLAVGQASSRDSLQRLRTYWQAAPDGTLAGALAASLRDRPLHGRIALHALADFPLAGVGVGSFNTVAADVAAVHGLEPERPFENALNWYLHQLAELGLVGSLGWMLWLLVLARGARRGPPPGPEERVPAILLGGVLAGFAVASLFGVHTQAPEVLLAFWALVAWLARLWPGLADGTLAPGPGGGSHGASLAPAAWGAILLGALLCAGLQAHTAAGDLQHLTRAARAGWSFESGFYPWEQNPDWGRYRWTSRRAVAIIPVLEPHLQVTLWASHPDLQDRPLVLEIEVAGGGRAEVEIADSEHRTVLLELPTDREWVVLSIEVARTWRPAEAGSTDSRELGVAVAPWMLTSAP